MPVETIARAAIRYEGTVYDVERPGRHHNVIRKMHDLGFGPECMRDQGFVTASGYFVGRRAGMRIAEAADQLIAQTSCGDPDVLYSEDLW